MSEEPLQLAAAVRERIVQLAAARLGVLPADQVPTGLRAFARFTPARRARLAAGPLAAALETDVAFRQRVADGLRDGLPALAAAVEEGTALPAAPPEDLAAAAYLLRPSGWRLLVAEASGALSTREDAAAGAADVDAVRRLTEQLEAVRLAARTEAERLRTEGEAARAEVAAVRRKLREMGDRAGRAETARGLAERALADERAALHEERRTATAQARRLHVRVADAEQALAAARTAARAGRHAEELRLRVLLDALLGAAGGLRRELALPPLSGWPADAVVADYAPDPAVPALQGRQPDDPALLDALLAVPVTHLLVDGYNVTKTGYGAITLEAQRLRLLRGLGALAARTGAEVTVVFDGAEQPTAVSATAPRGVRLLFSRHGETADEVLRRLARLEPPGRPVVVVSSDREVADGVRAAGARPLPALALVRLLARS